MDFSEVESHYYRWLHFKNDPLLVRILYSLVLANRWDSDPVWALLVGPSGSGKCLGRGTQVLMYDGTTVNVEKVLPGDQLMGPDSRPRLVRTTSKGWGPLYRIVPTKGEPWVCNADHVLTLVQTGTDRVLDVALNEYLAWSEAKRRTFKLFKPDLIEWDHDEHLPVSPYFLGVWLGDGGKDVAANGVRITKPDEAIFNACLDEAERFGLRVETSDSQGTRCPTHRIVGQRGKLNPLKELLRPIQMRGFSIPHEYLTASRTDRLELLAGLLDTDGSLTGGGYDFVQKLRPIAEGAVFLARSLGFRAELRPKRVNDTDYWRVSISGHCETIPLRIPRKKAPPRRQIKRPTRTGFEVEPIGEGEYFGFTLDGDGRFLLGDFTVTHNTELLTSLTGSDQAVFVSTLTPYALASGFGTGDDSLLFQLDGNFLVVEDMSAVTELNADARNTLFSFLRSAYNGSFTRATGRGKIEWQGKFGMLGGAVPLMEASAKVDHSLGERFLYLRPKVDMADQDDLLERVLGSATQKGTMRTTLKNVAGTFLKQDVDTKDRKLKRSVVDVAKGAAIALSRVRTNAIRHSYSRDIEFPLEVSEMGTRLLTQFLVVALAAKAIGTAPEQIEDIIFRLMLDSMPYVRCRILRLIHSGTTDARGLTERLKMSNAQVHRHLEELRLLKIISLSKRKEYSVVNDTVAHALDRE